MVKRGELGDARRCENDIAVLFDKVFATVVQRRQRDVAQRAIERPHQRGGLRGLEILGDGTNKNLVKLPRLWHRVRLRIK